MRFKLALLGALAALPASPAAATTAPTLTTLYSFPGGGDGLEAYGGLVNVSGTLYGTTLFGGAAGRGAVYSINPATGAETLVYSFQAGPDVAYPQAGLLAVGSLLYGVASSGGANGFGGIYAIDPATGTESVVFSFTAAMGGGSGSSLINSSGTLYGTTYGAAGAGASFGVVFAYNIKKATETTLYTFTGAADGGSPQYGLTLANGVLYGTATTGGANHAGTIFAVNATTGAETTLMSFDGASLGGGPYGGVINVDGVLYGTASYGGGTGNGVIFSYTLKTSTPKVIYNFTGGADGGSPQGGLLDVSGVLYATTSSGGANGLGTVVSVNAKTGAEKTLYTFAGGANGGHSLSPLIDVSGVLYGTDLGSLNASVNNGTVFSITLSSGAEKTLHSFTGASVNGPGNSVLLNEKGIFYGTTGVGGTASAGTVFTYDPATATQTTVYNFTGGADGGVPEGGLIVDTGILYGVAASGGANKTGAIFTINPTTNAEAVIYSFPAGAQAPNGPLVQYNGILYGTTEKGGTYGAGSVFAFSPAKKTLTTVYSFSDGPDGGFPLAGLAQNSGMLYGTTQIGGTGGAGTVFQIDIATGTETVLYDFTDSTDGGYPRAAPVYMSGVLYGTAPSGGTLTPACFGNAGCGVLYSVTVASSAYSVLHSFNDAVDGALPNTGLSVINSVIYGATSIGGTAGGGTIFSYTPASSTFNSVYNFTAGADGAAANGGLIALKTTLYGATSAGGPFNTGTLFSLLP